MRSAPSLFVVCMLVGCTPRGSAPTTAPDPVEPSASASSQSPLDVSSDAEPEPSPADASVTAGASESGLWFEPLPALTLASLSDEQKVRSQECGKTHRVSEPDVTVVELMAAAECFADIPVPGHEIRIYRYMLQNHPQAPQNVDATRRLGQRYEQIDVRPRRLAGWNDPMRSIDRAARAVVSQ